MRARRVGLDQVSIDLDLPGRGGVVAGTALATVDPRHPPEGLGGQGAVGITRGNVVESVGYPSPGRGFSRRIYDLKLTIKGLCALKEFLR